MPPGIDGWRAASERQAKSLLRLMRLLADDLGNGQPAWAISASLLGGYFGRDKAGPAGLPTAGAALGVLRSLELEWTMLHGKAIDFDRCAASEIAASLVRELGAMTNGAEVGYPRGERLVYSPSLAPLGSTAAEPLALPENAVVLATGGARGITAELLRSVVRPGMTVVLVGRSPLETDAAMSEMESADPAALRRTLIERDRVDGAQRRPAEIEQAVAAAMRRSEVARSIAKLSGMGVIPEYHALDVSDAPRFSALIADVYARHGRIDLVLHGAGVIEDKHLVDKSDASIDRVFDAKADSAFTLYRSLDPATLKGIVFFASLAGRLGNRGQADYAAANEVLNRLAWRMAAEWPRVRVLSINWGPWARIGMAVEALNVVSRRLLPIEPEAGRAFFLGELARGASGEVEILAGDVAGGERQRAVSYEAASSAAGVAELVEAAGDS